jgi:hypothetical protein
LRDFAREVVYTTLARLVEIARALFAAGLKQKRAANGRPSEIMPVAVDQYFAITAPPGANL